MNAWELLDISPTSDQRAVKKAYAKQLKKIDQETQTTEFIALREALEEALIKAENLAYENEIDDQEDDLDWSTERDFSTQQNNENLIEEEFNQLEQNIVSQNINFNLRDSLSNFKFNFEAEASYPSYLERIEQILITHDLADFIHHLNASTQEHTISTNFDPNIEDTTHTPLESSIRSPLIEYKNLIDTVVNALLSDDLSDDTYKKFEYLIRHQNEMPLDLQIEFKDNISSPLAQVASEVTSPKYYRFLELWNITYPEDHSQYDDSYQFVQLQNRLNEYLEKREMIITLSEDQYSLLEDLEGEKAFKPLKMMKVQKILGNKFTNQLGLRTLDLFNVNNKEININYLFLKSLNNWDKFAWLTVLITISSYFIVKNFFIHQLTTTSIFFIMLTIIFCYFPFVQAPLQAWISGRQNQKSFIENYGVYWFLSGVCLCAFTNLLSPKTHQILSYCWLLFSLPFLGSMQLIAPAESNNLYKSEVVNLDRWAISFGLLAITVGLGALYKLVGDTGAQEYPWLIVYSLIPISILFFPHSFKPIFFRFAYTGDIDNLTKKNLFYKNIGIFTFRLIWILSAGYFFISTASQPYYLLATLAFGSLLISLFKVDYLSKTILFLSFTGIFALSAYTIIGPFILIYYLYKRFKVARSLMD